MIRAYRLIMDKLSAFSSAKPQVPLNPAQFEELSQKHTVLDVRGDFKDGMVKGAYWLFSGMADGRYIANWLPLVVKPEQSYLIYADKGQGEQFAQLFAVKGYTNMLGYNDFQMKEYDGEAVPLKLAHIKDLSSFDQYTHVDVRNPVEWKQCGIIQDSILTPLPVLQQNINEVKKAKGTVLVHCAGAVRARFAWSILQRHGIHDSYVFNHNFSQFQPNGLPIVAYEPSQQK